MPQSTLSTDWIRVCTSGTTADKRPLDAQVLLDIAANYDPALYEARIYPVHLYEWSYDRSPVGDVLAIKAEPFGDKTAIYAKLRPSSDMLRLNERQQLCYMSLEIDPDFSDTGKPYLVGAALTDQPACLGLERIQLSSQQQRLAVTEQLPIELATLAPKPEPGVFARLAQSLSQFRHHPETPKPSQTEVTMPDPDNNALTQLSEQMNQALTLLSKLAAAPSQPAPKAEDNTQDADTHSDELTQLKARLAELESENQALKSTGEQVTQLAGQLAQMQQQIVQLGAIPGGQKPNPAGITGADEYEDVV
ncbi:GPO family capsid scaffolding protein [Shewanella algae]|uniref:GPO family capsid scaffolding protein n=1 Tax=Shewanella algae TaxID=38313 RepID=UPI001AAC81BB|nr:GPO family capsid scaffolding protein [Shewanella algae]MBO2604276.1 GPO family capsid scaffolding protein [Shewanella algae]